MKILSYLAILALFSGSELLASCNMFSKNTASTSSKTKPQTATNVGSGGLKFTAPAAQTTRTTTPATNESEDDELAPPQLSLGILKSVTSLLGKVPSTTTTTTG